MDVPVEKRFAILCEIARAQHFAWREAVVRSCPEVDPQDVVARMWEITGEKTAQAYARHIDAELPLAEQVAKSIVWSSACMGEEATFEPGVSEDEAFVSHTHCPWLKWHEEQDLLEEDRAGCDRWFASTVTRLGELLGVRMRFETLEAMPTGAPRCRRRIWVEP